MAKKNIFKSSGSLKKTGAGLDIEKAIRDNITIIPELRDLIPPLAQEEFGQLEQNILEDPKGIREPILIWEFEPGKYAIVDGHNRYSVAQKNNLQFPFSKVSFSDMEEAKDWMIFNQLGRRNLSPMQASYLRGLLYNTVKQEHGGDRKSRAQNEPLKDEQPEGDGSRAQNELLKSSSSKSVKEIAEETKVSPATIKRDGNFAKGLEKIGKANPEVKAEILAGNTKIKKSDIEALASIELPNKLGSIEELEKALGQREIKVQQPSKKDTVISLKKAWHSSFTNRKDAHKVFSSVSLPDSPQGEAVLGTVDQVYYLRANRKKGEPSVLIGVQHIKDANELKERLSLVGLRKYFDYFLFLAPEKSAKEVEEFWGQESLKGVGFLTANKEREAHINVMPDKNEWKEWRRRVLLEEML